MGRAKGTPPAEKPAKRKHPGLKTQPDIDGSTPPGRRRKPGRPWRLGPEVYQRLVELVRQGAYLAHAAAALGVDRRTVQRWRQQGEQDRLAGKDTPLCRLVRDLDAARALAAIEAQNMIILAGERDWRASAWYLERVHPEHYGPVRDDAPRAGHALDLRDIADDETIASMSDGDLELLDRSFSVASKILERAKARAGHDEDDDEAVPA